MEVDEFAKAIDSCWFTPFEGEMGCAKLRTYAEQQLQQMKRESERLLWELRLCFLSRSLEGGEVLSHVESREAISSSLVSTLCMAVLSEHVLDKLLLLPREMRERDLLEIAKAADLDPEELRSFYFRWHSEYRKRFYETDDES